MSLQGLLRSLSIPDLFSFLQQQKKTGLLSLVSRRDERGILFQKGDLVFATACDCSRRLGTFLVSLGFLNESELGKSTGAREWGVNFLGQELLERASIHPDELFTAVRKQILDVLDEVLLWEDGAFHFDEWFDPNAYQIPAGPLIGTRNLLLEAIRRYDESQLIRASFPDLSTVLRSVFPDPMAAEAAGLDAAARETLALVDGSRTVAQILRDSLKSPYETSKVLTALSQAGHIQPVPLRGLQDIPTVPEPWTLPVSPEIPSRIYWIFNQKSAGNLAHLAEEIGRDPALAAKALLQFTAARLALPREKFNIASMVEALGNFRTRALLIPEVVRGIFYAEKDFFWKDYCEQGVLCARFCHELAGIVGYPYPEEAYMAGLLNNLGIFILVGAFPGRYRKILEESAETRRDLCELEEAAFGVSHMTIGGIYAERWKFPKPIIQAIRHHHQDRERPTPLLDLVTLGNWVSRIRQPALDFSASEEVQVEGALKRFRLKRKKVLALWEQVGRECVAVS